MLLLVIATLGLALVWVKPRWVWFAGASAFVFCALAFFAWDFGDGEAPLTRIAPHVAGFLIAGALIVWRRGKSKMSVGL